jgi:virulence factor Mce-like protein
MRNRNASIAASPMLIGAVTVLVTVVAVFLSYNANEGLPFVPTYKVSARVPNAQGLIPGNEVRVGGLRVGVVDDIKAEETDARPVARLDLKLDKTAEPLYAGARITVRPRSPLGLKYVEIIPHETGRPLGPGDSLALSRARPTVDLDQVLSALDPPTRRSLQVAVAGLGTGFAGRGEDVNAAIESFPPLLARATPVFDNLADPRTRLAGLVRGAGRVAAELAPVAPQLGSMVAAADTTAGALASVAPDLQRVLEDAPPTLDNATRTLIVARPVLNDARALVHDLRPGTRVLPSAARRLHAAIDTGIPVLRRALKLSDRLRDSLAALDTLARDPATRDAVQRLLATLRTALPYTRRVAPMQTVCNYLGLWTRNVTSTISEGDTSGTWFRTLVVAAPDEAQARAEPSPNLHANPYGNAAAPGQERECEVGNEPYREGRQIGNVPGNQGAVTEATGP